MRIEWDENWLMTITSGTLGDPDYHQAQVQIGAGKVPYTDNGRLTLSPPIQLRNCQWLVPEPPPEPPLISKRVWDGGVLHAWITDDGKASAIVEDEEGRIRVVPARSVRMIS